MLTIRELTPKVAGLCIQTGGNTTTHTVVSLGATTAEAVVAVASHDDMVEVTINVAGARGTGTDVDVLKAASGALASLRENASVAAITTATLKTQQTELTR